MNEAPGQHRDSPSAIDIEPALAPASFAGGRYQVIRFLGRGSRKEVYLARDSYFDRLVAIGLVRVTTLGETARERALKEARAVGRLGSHPNLVAIYEVAEDGDNILLVEEYMSGGDLRSMPPATDFDRNARILTCAKDICAALVVMHSAGIAHADIKPANIFLSGDGHAKLGDFGLSTALDRPTAVQQMTILGTAAYIAPERALGQPPGPASDLYALGVTLYELVAGRLPFPGKDATSVISQHINSVPVPPINHARTCPLALNTLIMRLLAKDPSARPGSAAEVLAELSAIAPGAGVVRRRPSSAALASGVFVGRDAEIRTLREALESALGGSGNICLITGEAGAGKSRIVEQVETMAGLRGAAVLGGQVRESAGAPAYWPWIEIGNAYASEFGLSEIGDLGDSARHLIRLFPGLRSLLPDIPEPDPVRDPSIAQELLFETYSELLRRAADAHPCLVVLEDFHLADAGSMELLEYLAAKVASWRILVVATLRDEELPREHPLRRTRRVLAALPHVRAIPLPAFTAADIQTLIIDAAGVTPAVELTEMIAARTDGNPFFVSEIVKHLAGRGASAFLVANPNDIPASVWEAIGARLVGLDAQAKKVLPAAAVFGREFRVNAVARILDLGDADVAAVVAAAIDARLVDSLGEAGYFRFGHTLLREALLQQLDEAELARLNGRAGDVLEDIWGAQASARSSRLAEHFAAAAMREPRYVDAATHYALEAASIAESALGWAEAANHFKRALAFIDASDPARADRAEALESAGRCLKNAGRHFDALSHYRRAMESHAARGDYRTVARLTLDAITIPSQERPALLDAALKGLGDADPHLEGLLATHRLRVPGLSADRATALEHRLRNILSSGDFPDLKASVKRMQVDKALESGENETAATVGLVAFEELAALGEIDAAAGALQASALAESRLGNIGRSRDAFSALEAFCRSARLHVMAGYAAMSLACCFRMLCEWDRFNEALARIPSENWTRHTISAERMEIVGDLDAAVAMLPPPEMGFRVPAWQFILHGSRARILFNSGRMDEAKSDIMAWTKVFDTVTGGSGREMVETISFSFPIDTAISLADEACVALVDDELARHLYGFLVRNGRVRCGGDFRGLDQIRGALAIRFGDLAAAEEHYRSGLEWGREERLPAEVGRCLQGLATVAARRGHNTDALIDLNEAAITFAQHGLQLYLGQVIREKLRLQGALGIDPQASIDLVVASTLDELRLGLPDMPGDGAMTIAFTDIEASTPTTEKIGDSQWLALLREHNAIIRSQVARAGGREVKTIGDAFMLAFTSPRQALRCALAVQQAFQQRNAGSALPIRISIGIHTGRMVEEQGDFFGHHVNIAARIGTLARAGEILVSEELRQRTSPFDAATWRDRGSRRLKGIAEPVHIWAVC